MPAGKTYTRIASQTTTGSVQTVTFSNLPQNFTDLVCVMQVVSSSSNTLFMRFNSNTGSNYSATRLSGSGTSAVSDRDSNATYGLLSNYAYPTSTAGNTNTILQIPNYSNTTTNKTFLVRSNSAGAGVDAIVGLWRQTSAIDSISFSTNGFTSSTSISSGSTFTIYGIAASQAPQAIGGTITTDGSYWYHTFTSSGVFTPQQSINADVLVIAGGGGSQVTGSGGGPSGGGGAGGLLGFTSQSLQSNTPFTVTVGAGGANTTGSDSRFGSLTLVKGGGLGGGTDFQGSTGGSGGGSGGRFTSAGGSATSGQGNAGGKGAIQASLSAGGGGGATAPGADAPPAGNGGNGSSSYSSWGLATGTGQLSGGIYYYAGGGAGQSWYSGTNGTAGLGGGGAAGTSSGTGGAGSNGTANTGGGGGGGNLGSTGGSGIVIVRYPI